MKRAKQDEQVSRLASHQIATGRRLERALAENRPTLLAFAEWLAETRGLAPGSVKVRLHSACCFIDAVTVRAEATGGQALQSLNRDDVEGFFIQYSKDHGMAARHSMRSAMRLLLKFAAGQGWVGWELMDAVPSLRDYRLRGLPRGLSDEELSTLLSSPWDQGRYPRRDRAVVYLLATYGVRRGHVAALKLKDIDWIGRTIHFAAHKGGKLVRQILTPAVAESLAEYLQHERPAFDCEYVFLRQNRPHGRLEVSAISALVIGRMLRCGLPPRSPHTLRHAFATRLLRVGQPIKAIADLLGHRSLDSAAIYAKVDHIRLFEVAVEWPEEAR